MTQYRTTTDENGDFSLDLPALEKGTYTMKAIFEGDSDAYGSEITKTLIIQGRAYTISIEANNEIIQSGDTTTLTLSFEDEDGDPVIEPSQTIKLYQEYVVSNIILTSDKDILSYADNDVATLTAQVKTSSGGIPVGVDVIFKKDGVLLDTVQTNTQGIATYLYTSTGAGDITFSAECDLQSETFTMMDCLLYDPLTTDTTANYYWSSTDGNNVEYDTADDCFKFTIGTEKKYFHYGTTSYGITGTELERFKGKTLTFKAHLDPSNKGRLTMHYFETGASSYVNNNSNEVSTSGDVELTVAVPSNIERLILRVDGASNNANEIIKVRNWRVYPLFDNVD